MKSFTTVDIRCFWEHMLKVLKLDDSKLTKNKIDGYYLILI